MDRNLDSSGGGILARADGSSIAYRRRTGKSPGILFLHGYRSDQNGIKAQAIEAFAGAAGLAFTSFDCWGHGGSPGDIELGTIGRWLDDSLAVLDHLTEGPQILAGSSMGGWLALLAALERPKRVHALLGIATAPDFTEERLWATLSQAQRRELFVTGKTTLPGTGWTIARGLIEEGRNHLLLGDTINLSCPVRLLQGQKDESVPWETALRLADCLAGGDVEVTLIKDGDHRLGRPSDLARLTGILEALVKS